MLKSTTHRKSALKKRNASISDDEANRRRLAHQFIEREKQRKLLVINDLRKNNNQLDVLRDILFTKRDVNELIQKQNNHNIVRNGTNRSIKKTKPTSAKTLNSSSAAHWKQSAEGLNYTDNLSANSAGEEEVKNGPVRLSRSNKKMTRSGSLFSPSRQRSSSVRSINNVPFMSDVSNIDGKVNGTESTVNTSPGQFRKLLHRLSSELNDLESITGFKPNKNDLLLNNQSNTSSTALLTALLTLTGHVKQCAVSSKGKHELNNLKDQLSVVIKAQLDFQQKIENQMSTLQTMMQTICQLVNNEIISNKKISISRQESPRINSSELQSSRARRDQTDFEISESRQSWLNRQTIIPKHASNAMDELLTFSRRMSNATPIDANEYHQPTNNSSIDRHSAYIETLEASKRLTRPTSSMSTNETNGHDISKQTQQYRNLDHESHSSMISPIDEIRLPYDGFETGLPNGNSSISTFRNGIGASSSTVPSASMNETILEKILHERLRLVQQMAELNKQHETTQEELANLEGKTLQPRTT